jgi:hypothetical protein
MRKLPRREPLISPGGGTRFLMIIALIVVSHWLYGVVQSIVEPPFKAAFDTVWPPEPKPGQHTRP